MCECIHIRVENIIYTVEKVLFDVSPFFNNFFYSSRYIEDKEHIIDLDISTQDWLSLNKVLNFIFKRSYVNYFRDPWDLDDYDKNSLSIGKENDSYDLYKESFSQYIVKLTWDNYEGLINTLEKFIFTNVARMISEYKWKKLYYNITQGNYEQLIEGLNILDKKTLKEFLSEISLSSYNILKKVIAEYKLSNIENMNIIYNYENEVISNEKRKLAKWAPMYKSQIIPIRKGW